MYFILVGTFLQLLQLQIQTPGIVQIMNNSDGDTTGTNLVGRRSNSIVTTNLNSNSTLNYIPRVAFITPTVEPTTFPLSTGNVNTMQTCSSSAPSMINVITCAGNVMNSQLNNAGFVMAKNGHSSTVSVSEDTVPIYTGANGGASSTPSNSKAIQADGTNIKEEGEVVEMLHNSGEFQLLLKLVNIILRQCYLLFNYIKINVYVTFCA